MTSIRPATGTNPSGSCSVADRDAYDSAPARGAPPGWSRVYRKGGRKAHLVHYEGLWIACDDLADPKMGEPSAGSWLGTGSQQEYDRAASLPLCLACFAVREAGRFGETDDPATDERYQ